MITMHELVYLSNDTKQLLIRKLDKIISNLYIEIEDIQIQLQFTIVHVEKK